MVHGFCNVYSHDFLFSLVAYFHHHCKVFWVNFLKRSLTGSLSPSYTFIENNLYTKTKQPKWNWGRGAGELLRLPVSRRKNPRSRRKVTSVKKRKNVGSERSSYGEWPEYAISQPSLNTTRVHKGITFTWSHHLEPWKLSIRSGEINLFSNGGSARVTKTYLTKKSVGLQKKKIRSLQRHKERREEESR